MAEQPLNESLITGIIDRFHEGRGIFRRTPATLVVSESPVEQPPGTRWDFEREMNGQINPLGNFTLIRMSDESPGAERGDGRTIVRAMIGPRLRRGDSVRFPTKNFPV
jgi:hypothetical protein